MNDVADHPPPADAAACVETATGRRRATSAGHRKTVVAIVAVVAALGGGAWWHHQVTRDPSLELYGHPNLSRDEAGYERAGLGEQDNWPHPPVSTVTFEPNGRLYVHLGLYNGGAHAVRIEQVPPAGFFYWGLDRMSRAAPEPGGVTVAQGYEPFRPFTLARGETVNVRLEYRLADCDPAELQPNATSTVSSLRLRYRILGISRTAHVPFRDTAIALQAGGGCRNAIVRS